MEEVFDGFLWCAEDKSPHGTVLSIFTEELKQTAQCIVKNIAKKNIFYLGLN